MTSSRSFTCAASLAFGSFSRYFVKYCFAFSSCFAFSNETATLNRNAGYGLCSYADRKRSAATAYSPRTNAFCADSNASFAAPSDLSGVDSSARAAAPPARGATQRCGDQEGRGAAASISSRRD
jgi:hypothetical protein